MLRSKQIVMKRLENFLLKACGFTVAILTLFYLFPALSRAANESISFSTFALIFGFGMLISIATMIFEIKSINLVLRILIHYIALMVAFCTVFISTGNISADTPAKIFTAVIIFTVFYAFFFGLTVGIKKLVRLIDDKADKHSNTKRKTNSKAESKKPYKSLYSDN